MQISDFQTVSQLFSEQHQYKIPRYQRRYVWSLNNWETLWQDITQLTGQDITQLTDNPIDTHFAGTIMMYQEKGMVTEIIDGQQRLTTFQLILCVIRDLWESHKDDSNLEQEVRNEIEGKLGELTKMGTIGSTNTHGFRIIPSKLDVGAFNSVVSRQLWDAKVKDSDDLLNAFESIFNDGLNENGKHIDQHLIVTAYGYFGKEIIKHLKEITLSKLAVLFRVFTTRSQVIKVSIESDDKHDPERIFQTINDTGRMLTDFDYLRNYLFLRTRKQLGVEHSDEIYERYWDRFEKWPDGELKQFFQTYLKAKLGPRCFENESTDIRPFDSYRKHIKILEGSESNFFIPILELSRYADSYEELNITDENRQKLDNRMRFYDNLQLPRLDWLLLYMKYAHEPSDSEFLKGCTIENIPSKLLEDYPGFRKQNSEGLSSENLYTFCNMLESYIVRSWLCNNDYKPSYEYIISFLDDQHKCKLDVKVFVEHLTKEWPDPDNVEEILKEKTNLADSNLLLYILYRIVPQQLSTNTTPVDFKKLNLKKILKQADIYINLLGEVDAGKLVMNRIEINTNAEKIANSIGNITFERSELKDSWNMNEIKERTENFLKHFNTTWKSKVRDFNFER